MLIEPCSLNKSHLQSSVDHPLRCQMPLTYSVVWARILSHSNHRLIYLIHCNLSCLSHSYQNHEMQIVSDIKLNISNYLGFTNP